MKNKPALAHPAESLVLARVSPDLKVRLARLSLMVFDVDGILTDGSLWYGENGEVFKRFHSLDGHGLKMLATSGIKVALVTGREGPIVARRAAELGLGDVMQNVRDKGAALTSLASRHNISLDQTGFMGDDLIDLPPCKRPGLQRLCRRHPCTFHRQPTGYPPSLQGLERHASVAT